jgi:hypothetical protein
MKNRSTEAGRSSHRKWLPISGAVAAAVGAYLLFAPGGTNILHPNGPNAVKDKTVHALRIRDAEALCALADPAELQKLHLTPAVVKEWLNETLPGKDIGKARVILFRQQPADERGYDISWPDDVRTDQALSLSLLDDQKTGWHLDLSDFLWTCCFRHSGSPGGIEEYVKLAKKYGVTGKLSPAGGYYASVEELERAIPADKKL